MRLATQSMARWSIAGLAAAAMVCGCADTTQLQTSQTSMREMIANDQQQIASLQDKVAELDDKLTDLQHNGVTPSAGGSGHPAVNAQIARLQSEVAALQANQAAAPSPGATDTGTAGAAGGAAADGGADSASDTTGANGNADAGGVASTTPPGPAGESAAPAVPASGAPPGAASNWRDDLDRAIAAAASSSEPGVKSYRAGLAAMKRGNYRNAIVALAQFQHAYPKSALGEPAEYFSANALYESGKYDQSVLQFNDLVMRYPQGRYASAALLREAQAFEKLNDRIDARLTLQKVISDHPDSPEAASANAMMQSLAND